MFHVVDIVVVVVLLFGRIHWMGRDPLWSRQWDIFGICGVVDEK